jgi:long-chain acyl-CoA synthetase
MRMEIKRIFDLLPYYKSNFEPKDDVLAGKEGGSWVKYSIDQYIENVEHISYGLIKLGVQPGDRVATISNNRPEWNFLDMAISIIGGIHVPIYPTISEADYTYILNHAGVKLVFVAGQELLRKIRHILPEVKSLEGLYTFKHIDDVKHLDDLITLGRENPAPEEVSKRSEAIGEHDVVTIIYTSGTTGTPKGVMLSHHNLLSNAFSVYHIFPIDQYSRGLSYLPLCHVYERMNIYTYHYLGVSIYYAESMGAIGDNIREISPHILTTVPRLLEKVYDKIMAKGHKLTGIKKKLFFWAVKLGLNYEVSGKSIIYRAQLALANKLIFSKWREALGGRMRVIVSGGAALQPRLARVFTAARIPVLEGYGLTETSPVVAVNTFEKGGTAFGTVGKPLANVEVMIAGDGEILVRGPNVMKGYFREPDQTAAVIDNDQWFHTGDIGRMEPEGHLRITGRKKEIFKTSLGKYISPAQIENKFTESSLIDAIIVVGENQKYAAALLVPDFTCLRTWCQDEHITYSTNEEMANHKAVRERFRKEVDHFNSFLGNTEKIMSFAIMGREWSVENGELTASLKLRRNYIMEKYRKEIEGLFK